MAVYYSGDETTERESLADTIAVRSPMSVPMLSRLPQKTIYNRVHQWSVDVPFTSSDNVRLPGTPHANTRFEGDAYSYRSTSFPLKLKAICEIQSLGIQVSGTDRTVVMAGADNTFDYRAGQLATTVLNGIDNALMFGVGSPETSGKYGGADTRRVQGALFWAAWTGLERCHGTKTTIEDPYGVDITSPYFSTCYNFAHTNITGESFFQNVVRRACQAGADMDQAWEWWAGRLTMSRISKFLMTDTGRNINDRQIAASEGGGYDYLHWIVLPDGTRAIFRTNHWLDDMNNTFTVDNTGATLYTPGTPDPEGSISAITCSGDQTIWGHRPGSVKVCWLREPGFEAVPVDGDSSKLACKAEFTLEVNHPLDVAAALNTSA